MPIDDQTAMDDLEPESIADKFLNLISEDAKEFVTEFVVLANCMDTDGDHTFYYLTGDRQRLTNTLGMLEGAVQTVKNWIVESYNQHIEDMDEEHGGEG